jgi:hypothetical protein
VNVVARNVIRCGRLSETTINSTGRRAGIVTVGGVTEPLGRIVNRAGTRTLIAPVVVVVAVFVVDVVLVFGGVVRVVAVVVAVAVAVVAGKVAAVVVVDEVEVDFEPPQPATASAPKRTASRLTFAG